MHYETVVASFLDILKESKTGQAVLREIMHAPKGRAMSTTTREVQ